MYILGYHGAFKREDEELRSGFGSHDAAAVLLHDGSLVAAIEEERLSRLKHANAFPFRAIQHCLDRAGISLDQVTCIATNRDELFMDRATKRDWLNDPGVEATRTARTLANDCFKRAFGSDVASRLCFCPHHVAHAWSAFTPSGFGEALIFVPDGDGDHLSGMVLVGRGRELATLREFPIPKSIGNWYTRIIMLLGYNRFDEYKVMGLAPYGNPRVYEPLFRECYRLLPGGDYEIDAEASWQGRLHGAGLVDRARRKGQPFEQVHMDLAAAAQATIERIVLHILSCYRKETGLRNLCLAGGVAHNCSVNGAILYSGLFDRVFVQPAAHDAGGAFGAAVHACHRHGGEIRDATWKHVYLGTHIGTSDAVQTTLRRWGGLVEIEDIGWSPEEPARLLASGAVLGWAQDRSEFGPRALGNRSILADPRPVDNKSRINAMVKKREAFRPFAPAVLVERVRDYFEVPGDEASFPFMIFVLKVRPEARGILGAVTHVDGTARVQTVSREDNAPFWSLIHAFGERTGVPILLNTSFNNNAEPIVDTVEDAVACLLTTGLDCIVVANYLVRKKSADAASLPHGDLSPQVPAFRRIVKRRLLNSDTQRFEDAFTLESTRSASFGPPEIPLSGNMYRALLLADGRRPLSDLASQAGVAGCDAGDLYREAHALWTARAIHLQPA
jgi:carbamoyltransferase